MFRWTALSCILGGLLTLGGCAFNQKTPAADSSVNINVLSYNIHIAIGMDGQRDLDRIARIITESQADLVALQEVDRGTQRSIGQDQAQELAQRTGMHVVFGKTINLQGGEYGIAVLSRHPILESKTYLLPSQGTEQRVALETRIRLEPSGREVTFICTHLDHTGKTRPQQAEEINRLFLEREGTPIILAGDFNARPNEETIAILSPHWHNTNDGQELYTFQADQPDRQIDYIFIRPADRFEVQWVRVLDEAVASDHRPIQALLKLR